MSPSVVEFIPGTQGYPRPDLYWGEWRHHPVLARYGMRTSGGGNGCGSGFRDSLGDGSGHNWRRHSYLLIKLRGAQL